MTVRRPIPIAVRLTISIGEFPIAGFRVCDVDFSIREEGVVGLDAIPLLEGHILGPDDFVPSAQVTREVEVADAGNRGTGTEATFGTYSEDEETQNASNCHIISFQNNLDTLLGLSVAITAVLVQVMTVS